MDEFGNKPDENATDENIDSIVDEAADDIFKEQSTPELIEIHYEESEPVTPPVPVQPVSYRKSGPTPPMVGQSTIPYQPPQAQYYRDANLYEESKEEVEKRRKENSRFYRFIATVLIIAMVGAPFLGLGFGLGVRFFDSYFLPILMDDSAERANFSFDNVSAPIVTSQTPGSNIGRPNYVELVQLVEPSVVLISANMPSGSRNQFFNFGGPTLAGSGIIMYETSTRYYIATNAHVIAGAEQVNVSIAGSPKIPAMPVGRNDDADLAVIAVNRADAMQQGVNSVRLAQFGDSSLMQVGEAVVAIGNSMGEGNTVTNGIVSAIDREIFVADRHLPEVIQTNAAINQGNSGGPLVNLYGQVIGINTAKFSERLAEGMGYAIPSNVAMPILERIMHNHEAASDERPMIGIAFGELNERIIEQLTETYIIMGTNEEDLIMPEHGLLITRVFANSPAYRAGLEHHDIITTVNGIPMTAENQIIDIFSALSVGDTVTMSIIREGVEALEVEVVLGPHISSF